MRSNLQAYETASLTRGADAREILTRANLKQLAAPPRAPKRAVGSAPTTAAPSRDRVVGLAAPFEQRSQGRILAPCDVDFEVIHRHAFAARTVPLTVGHDGPVIGEARTIEYPDALYFEAKLLVSRSALPAAVSIGFKTFRERFETLPDGRRLRHVDVGWLTHVALVPVGAYPTWCAFASPDAYKRMTEPMRRRIG